MFSIVYGGGGHEGGGGVEHNGGGICLKINWNWLCFRRNSIYRYGI